MKAFLMYILNTEGKIQSLQVVKREELPALDVNLKSDAHFKAWLDWVDPGEAYLARGGVLYVCVDLTEGN